MAAMGVLKKYPFLDERTSYFLLVASLVVVAIGAVSLVYAIATVLEPVHRVAGLVSAAVLGAVLASLFGIGVASHFYKLHIPREDLRAETRYVAEHRRPHDVIVVDYAASYGFAYYWPHPRLTFRPNSTGQAFEVRVRGVRAVYVQQRTADAALSALDEAVGLWRAAPRGSRLYIVRTHLNGYDVRNWNAAFDTLHVTPRTIVTGREHPLVITKQ
jgi:hypothetical protein